jgi:hypothetical protein
MVLINIIWKAKEGALSKEKGEIELHPTIVPPHPVSHWLTIHELLKTRALAWMICKSKMVKTFQSYEWLCHDRISEISTWRVQEEVVWLPWIQICRLLPTPLPKIMSWVRVMYFMKERNLLMSKQHDSMPIICVYLSFIRKEMLIWRRMHSG